MIQPGAKSLTKIAVIGRGTAGSLAAASVTRLHPDSDHELHHIYDSRIPVIGVGEGSWPSLVQELQKLTDLPHETVQQRLRGTRKYGVAFQGGWGRRDRDFTHYFTPQQVSYAYHLSADLMGELLEESTRARHIDANVRKISRVDGGAEVEFEGRAPERYDLVFDARGFPKELRPEEHIDISFIPTNTAVIRRCPAVIKEEKGPVLQHTYTRAVARPRGWVFVIPLTAHTSYGYIFNRDVTDLAEVESDFDEFLEADGVSTFEQRAVIPFPNYVHRRIIDGAVTRIGNAAAFMEPLEATAIVSAQLQIGMVLHIRLNRRCARGQSIPHQQHALLRPVRRLALFVRLELRQRILASRPRPRLGTTPSGGGSQGRGLLRPPRIRRYDRSVEPVGHRQVGLEPDVRSTINQLRPGVPGSWLLAMRGGGRPQGSPLRTTVRRRPIGRWLVLTQRHGVSRRHGPRYGAETLPMFLESHREIRTHEQS